jgi:uncharacterized protein
VGVEVRPLGVQCNLQCTYCYQNPQREAGNLTRAYDLDAMKAAIESEGGPFALFGGEPLLLPVADLEALWEWGYRKYGTNAVQTNGALIDDEHVRLFKRYNVNVGISIDGPGELNDARRQGGAAGTRAATVRTEAAIARLCREGPRPSLIVTLHRLNASTERLPVLEAWLRELDALGVRAARIHLLESETAQIRAMLALSTDENIAALFRLMELQRELRYLTFDVFVEARKLLLGRDHGTSCVWNACDSYTTRAVRGVEGHGERSNCGRTNKDGIDFEKADRPGYERYLALYATAQESGGCAGCRFFLMCKGQCPGTAIDGDWRNRTEHCEVWKAIFSRLEADLLAGGQIALSLRPERVHLERELVTRWQLGTSAAVGQSRDWAALNTDAPDLTRRSWVGSAARRRWEPRLHAVRRAWSELEWQSVLAGVRACALVSIPNAEVAQFASRWRNLGLSAASVPAHNASALGRVFAFVSVEREIVRRALQAWNERDDQTIGTLLEYPACCRRFFHRIWIEAGQADTTFDMVADQALTADHVRTAVLPAAPYANMLWRYLGVRAVPHLPCGFGCKPTLELGKRLWDLARELGYADEADWIDELLRWPAEWSALHGIAEVKTPILKLVAPTDSTDRTAIVRWPGETYPRDGASGLRFPYRPISRSTRSHASEVEKTVIEDAFDALKDEAHGRRVTRLRITNYFNIVQLDDGSVGAAMHYGALPLLQLQDRCRAIERRLADDPLLLGDGTPPRNRLLLSIRVATLSALAAPLVRRSGNASFAVAPTIAGGVFGAAHRAVVIGFGGCLDELATSPTIAKLHVADLQYGIRRVEMDAACAHYRNARPDLDLTISDGGDMCRWLALADLVCITASALCNGTMEGLLREIAPNTKVVIQGQSGGIHPSGFFRRGVAVVSTTLKPAALLDCSERQMRFYLEGGLPSVYLTARHG